MRQPPADRSEQTTEPDPWTALGVAFERATGYRLRFVDADPHAHPVEVFGEPRAWLTSAGDLHPPAPGPAIELAEALLSQSLTTENLVGQVAHLWNEINFVYTIGESIGNPLDLREACQELLERALDAVGAARGSLYLVDNQRLVPFAVCGVPEQFVTPIPCADSESIAAWVVRHGVPLVSNDAASPPQSLRTHGFAPPAEGSDSYLCVPLEIGGGKEPLGTLSIAGKLSGQFSSSDQKLVSAIARQVAGAIHRTQLTSALVHHERLREELRLAGEIHASLLPQSVPNLPGYRVAAALKPASAVGGDYYDFIATAERLYVLIADVCGHGLGAALLVSTVRSTLRAACRAGRSPGEVLLQLNDVVGDLSGENGLFATAQVIELRGRIGRIAAAGHPPALVISAGDDVRRIHAAGPPAGALPEATFPELEFELEHDETLVIYTDGLLDASGAGGLVGFEASLVRAENREPAALVEHVLAWQERECAPQDDRTVVALRCGDAGDQA